jgi:hypothetical protein
MTQAQTLSLLQTVRRALLMIVKELERQIAALQTSEEV